MTVHITQAQNGKAIAIGTGFNALTFRENHFQGAMDPLVLVDHYTMTKPTFGAHPHAGLSAVSILFEDSNGKFHNRDSLGNDFDLMPGDLYWLNAGSGVVHDEKPRKGAKTHGLQVFVNLPAASKQSPPQSLHVKAQNIPIYAQQGCRVRILLGESNGITAQAAPALPITMLEGKLEAKSSFSHQLKHEENAWVYAISGSLTCSIDSAEISLSTGQSIAITQSEDTLTHSIQLENSVSEQVHFALFAAKPIREDFVQKGPFVMSTEADIAQVEADYAAGKLGYLD